MEKPGPRDTTERSPLIIERPDLQSWPQRALSGVLTTFFWMVWLVLWLPLVTLAGWVFFGWQFKFHMFDLGGDEGFFELIGAYLVVIAAMGITLLAWAKYNHLRFRNVERRKAFPAVTPAMLQARFGQEESSLLAWQRRRIMVVEHDPEGRIISVLPRDESVLREVRVDSVPSGRVRSSPVRDADEEQACEAV